MVCSNFTGSFDEPDLTEELVSQYIVLPTMSRILRGFQYQEDHNIPGSYTGSEQFDTVHSDVCEETDGAATDEAADVAGDGLHKVKLEDRVQDDDSGIDLDVNESDKEVQDGNARRVGDEGTQMDNVEVGGRLSRPRLREIEVQDRSAEATVAVVAEYVEVDEYDADGEGGDNELLEHSHRME